MPDGNEIYQFLKTNNLTDKDEKSFVQEYSDPKKAAELHKFFVDNKLTDKDSASFYDNYFKKKSQSAPSTTPVATSQSQLPLVDTKELLGTAIKRGQEMGGNIKNVVPSYETPNNVSESTSNANANRRRDLVEKVIPLANAEKAKSDLAVKEFSKKRLKASNIPEEDDYLSTEEATVRRRIADGDLGFYKNNKGEFEIKRTDGYGAGLVKTLTAPFETFINTVNATEDRNISNNYLASLPKNKAIEYLNLKIANPEAFDKSPESVPQNNMGGIGAKFLGENINLLLKGTVGAIAGTALAPETGGASFGQFLTTVKDVTNGSYASALESNYRKAKEQNPNLTDEEAYDMAEKTALVSGATALATNAALAGSISGKLPTPKVPVSGVVNGVKASLKHAIKTSPKSVGLAAGGSLATDATANLVGIDVPLGEAVENASEHAKGMAIMHFGMWGMTEPTKIPSYIRPQIENVVASAPREEVAKIYSDAENQGILPQGTTEKILGKLSEFDKAKAIVTPFAISEESKAAIAGKLLQKKPIEEALSALDKKAFPTKTAELEAQIEDINKDIDGIYKTNKPLSFEVDKQTGDKPTDKPLEDLKSTTVIMPKSVEEVAVEGDIKSGLKSTSGSEGVQEGFDIAGMKGNKQNETVKQEAAANELNREAGIDVYVARQDIEANGSKYTLSQIKENGNTNTFLIEDANGNEIGKAQLSADGNYLENIRIDENHRRKGLASKVYDFIELRKGIELEPSPNKQSKEAKALWDNRNLKKSVSNKANGGLLAKSLGEAMSKTFADFKNKQQVLLELENKYFEQKGVSKEDFNKLNEAEKAEIIKDAIKWKNDNPELVKAVEQSFKEQAPNSEVVSDVTKNIQDEIKTEAEKPIEQTDAGVPTSDELIASKEKSAIETEVGEAKSAASEWKAITEKEVKQAQAKYDAAKNRFEKTKKKVEEAQATQNNIFGGEQKGMFGMSGDEAKKTLNPLRKAAKEAKAELDDLQKRFEVQKTANEPELFTQKEYAQKDLDRAEAKKTHALVKDMPEPTDAEQIALRYIADGGKVSEQAINEVSGTVKRAKLNTSKRELKSTEARQRDYYLKDGETLDELAHRLWEKSNQDVSEIDIKDALMEAIGNHNTRLEASKAYLERYSPEYAEEQYYNKLAEQYADEHAKEEENIKKWLESEGEKRQDLENDEEHINQLIKQYEAEFKAENKQSEPTSEGKVTKKTSVGTSGKEDAAAKQKVTIRARDLATKLREGEANVLPDFLRAEIKGAKTSGATINEVFATALDTFADIYDKTEDFAKSVKEAATHIKDWYKENGKEYNEKELEDNLLNHFKEQLKTEETVPKSGGQEPPKPPIEESKGEDSGRDDDFDKLIHTTIESKEVRQTLSNAERVTGIESADETKDYNIQDRLDAIAQGESFIEKAKEKFGDEYVPRFLKYLEEKRGTLSTENYSLALLSLEVDLTKKAKADPSNLALAKQLEMVRGIVFKNQRSAARATGYGIIRDIALNGFSAREEMANQLLTTKERELKKKIEEALYADAETIQKEAESKLQEQEDTITLTAAELEAKVTEAAAKLRIEERRAERVEKKEKVHKAIDDFTEKWISKLSVKGAENLKSQGADIRTVMTAAAKAMKKAYDLGLETKEAVQQAVDYISDKLGTNEWDKEAYKKEAAAQLGLEYKTKGKESQFRQEYKALETERNRQLAIVDKLQTELTDLQKGIRKKVESKEPVKDTPEIEALKVKIKEEKVKLAATDATIKRIATKEVELQRLQERLPKVKTERDKRILSEREVELQKQIDAEKKAIKEAAIANGGGRLDKAKERVKLRMDEIRKEIAEKERKAKEENKPLNGDLEYDRLLEQEASLKKLRDKYLPEEKDPFEKEKQREQVKDALVKDIVDLNEQINARERAPKKEKADYSNDEEIVKLKKLKADKQAILEEIDPAAVPKEKTIAEKIKQSENNVQSQIDAIQKEIANGERDLKSAKKNPLQSKKLEQLREQKKSLEALRDKYLPKTSDPFEQQRAEKAARTNLTKEIIELNRQIQKGQKDVLTETKSPESEGIEKLMQEKRARQAILEALDPTPKMFVEQALIEKGFGKKIKVKTNNGVEERNVLDWTKLTGEERNIENISKNVGEVLQDKGFTEEQGLRIQDKFIDEYNRLSTDVLEKSQNKLASLNKKIVTAEQRSAGKKLAELYNLGLFEKDPAQFEYLLSRAIGTSEISIDRFRAIGDIAKTFDLIHKQKFNGRDLLGISKGTLEKILEDEVQIELNKQLNSKGNIKLAVADSLKSVVNISQRYGLTSLTQVVGNVTSGLSNTVMSNISALQTAGKIPKAVIDRANSARRAILKDMIVNGEVNFGSSGTSFTNRTNIDAMLKNMTDSQVYHTIASVWGGKAALDGVDSFYKVKMTNVKLYQHAFKILTTKRVINGLEVNPMTKAEAQNFLVEKLTGQSFEDAVSTAREFIKKANESAGKVVFKENRLMVERLANDIVKTALVVDGVITEEMVTAAYKSALGLAERNLGQKANNWFSKNISSASGALEKSYNDAVKEKHYDNAALLQVANAFYKASNKYVSGGLNWVVMGAENTGLGMLSPLYNIRDIAKLDLTSEVGVRDLEKAFLYEGKRRDAFIRGAVGAATSAVITGTIASTVGIDDFRKWRAKNPELAKYTDKFTPMWLIGTIAYMNSHDNKRSDKGMPEFIETVVGSSGKFDKSPRLIKSTVDLVNGKGDKALQIVGEIAGSAIDVPVPWRGIRDVDNLIRVYKGEKPYKVPKTPKSEQGFISGASKGGSIDYFKSWFDKK